MKSIILTLLMPLVLTNVTINAQQAEKTLVKSFNVKNYQSVFLDMEGDIQIKTWNEDQMRIMMTITLQDGTETVLKSLMKAGRYNLESEDAEGILKILAPGLDRLIKLRNGSDAGEQVSFVVFAPQNISIKTRNDESTGMIDLSLPGF